jgi:hypothetical protein
MYIVYGHNRKRLRMDRSRYYSPEEMHSRATRVSVDGLFLEIVSNNYQRVNNNIELLFACKLVSSYHVSLHDDTEIDTRCVGENLFMDTTTHLIETHCFGELRRPLDLKEDLDDDESRELHSPILQNIPDEFEHESPDDSPWGDTTVKSITCKRERRNANRNKSQQCSSPHADVLYEHEHEFMYNQNEDVDDT